MGGRKSVRKSEGTAGQGGTEGPPRPAGPSLTPSGPSEGPTDRSLMLTDALSWAAHLWWAWLAVPFIPLSTEV